MNSARVMLFMMNSNSSTFTVAVVMFTMNSKGFIIIL